MNRAGALRIMLCEARSASDSWKHDALRHGPRLTSRRADAHPV